MRSRRQPRVELSSLLKFTRGFFFFALTLQRQSQLKMGGCIVRRRMDRRSELRNRAFEITGIEKPPAGIHGEKSDLLIGLRFADFDSRLRFRCRSLAVAKLPKHR